MAFSVARLLGLKNQPSLDTLRGILQRFLGVNSTEVKRPLFSTVERVRDFQILRLGARIWDLRQAGWEIE